MSVSRLSLFRRSNGIYYVRVETHGQLLWRSTHCRTKRDALRRIIELKDLLTPHPSHCSLAQFADEYKAYATSRLSPRTLSGYMDSLKGFQRFVGDTALRAITPRMAEAFVSERKR
jgi:hypothetical protein